MSHDLSLSERERLVELSEAVDFKSEGQFNKQVSVIKESHFGNKAPAPEGETAVDLHEAVADEASNEQRFTDPSVRNLVESIGRYGDQYGMPTDKSGSES